METNLNKLLARQLKKHYGTSGDLPEAIKGIIKEISDTYDSFDDDAQMLQNSIEISSQELRDAFQKHKQDAEAQKETINKIKEAISALDPSMRNQKNADNPSNSSNLFDSLIKLIAERNRAEEDKKQSEETLNNQRTLFRTIIDLIPDAVYVKDSKGRKNS